MTPNNGESHENKMGTGVMWIDKFRVTGKARVT